MNVMETYCGYHFTTYTNVKSLRCALETNVLLHVNYNFCFKKEMEEGEEEE